MPTGFKEMSGTLLASAALVAASLIAPAPANAQVPYNTWCVLYFRDWCAHHWQAEGFASFAECWTFYKELQCRYEW